jgi:hypothetical protein
MRVRVLVALLISLSSVVGSGCPQEGFWPDDIPRPSEGEGEGEEGEGEGEPCDPACEDGTTCRDGACIADDLFCSPANPNGVCPNSADTCVGGACVDGDDACSLDNPDGACAGDLSCDGGVCVSDAPCAVTEPNGFCADGLACVDGRCQERDRLCSTENPTGLCGAGLNCDDGVCVPVDVQCGCVGAEVCVDGVCRTPDTLCSNENPAGLCDDGAVCVAGGCVDVGARCSAQNPTGVCPPGALCDEGVCAGVDGASLCDDDNDCTVDAFDVVRNRCTHTPRTGSCDDGNACTTDTCSATGQCTGAPIGGCVEPPVLDAVVTPTNVGALTLAGTKPAGASVVINDLTAVAESPDERWTVTVNLVPGENVYVVKSVDQGSSSATRELRVVYDITPPRTRVTPDGGSFLTGITATIASDEPARVFFTTDGTDPTENSASFVSLKQMRVFANLHLRMRAKDIAGNFEDEIVDVEFEVTSQGTSFRAAPTLPEGLIHAAAVRDVDGAVIVVGGSDGIAPQAGVSRIDPDTGAASNLASLSAARAGLTAVLHTDGAVYAIGGENAGVPKNTVEKLVGAAWTTMAPMPSTRHALSAVSTNGKIYVFGGKTNGGQALTNLEVYDATANTWSNDVEQLPRARAGGRAVLIDGLVYLVGGEGNGGVLVAEVDIYDPATDTWATGAPLPTPRAFAGIGAMVNLGTSIGGTPGIVVAGGLAAGGAAVATVEEYLVDEDRWVERAPLDAARHAAAFVDVDVAGEVSFSLDELEREVWLLGGQVGEDVVASSRAYRASRDGLRRLGDLPAPRFLHGVAVVDELAYVIGGRSFQESTVGWAYDPETGAATELPPLSSVQSGLAVVENGGRVYAIGGADSFGNAVPTLRAYDPAERRFVELQPMLSARSLPAAVSLGDEIVVVGGENGSALATVEIYDTRTNQWRTGPLLPAPRAGAFAVVADGVVVVGGGVDGAGAAVASVLKSIRNESGVITGWQGQSVSIAIDRANAVVEGANVVVFGGRIPGGLFDVNGAPLPPFDPRPFVYNARTNQLAPRVAATILPAVDARALARIGGRAFLFGGNDDAPTPAGTATVVEARMACFNGVQDGGEIDVDEGDGCGGGFAHNTGLGLTFFNEFPVEMTREAAIRACNAHFGVTTCRGTCGADSGSVSRDGTCSCNEPAIWVWQGSGTHNSSGRPGNVTGPSCGGIVGNWN